MQSKQGNKMQTEIKPTYVHHGAEIERCKVICKRQEVAIGSKEVPGCRCF